MRGGVDQFNQKIVFSHFSFESDHWFYQRWTMSQSMKRRAKSREPIILDTREIAEHRAHQLSVVAHTFNVIWESLWETDTRFTGSWAQCIDWRVNQDRWMVSSQPKSKVCKEGRPSFPNIVSRFWKVLKKSSFCLVSMVQSEKQGYALQYSEEGRTDLAWVFVSGRDLTRRAAFKRPDRVFTLTSFLTSFGPFWGGTGTFIII